MTVRILVGDALAVLRTLPDDHFDCVVTSPPYWGLRDYGVDGQLGLEPTLGAHIAVMVEVFDEVRRVMKPHATLWLNYGDCYAANPNGRTAAAIKAIGRDDRTFRDKPFSTTGAIPTGLALRGGRTNNLNNTGSDGVRRNFAGDGYLKPKDLCMMPNRLAIALQDAGWWVRSEIVWGKKNPMPDSSGKYRPSTAHEKIFLLTKSGKHFYDAEAVKLGVSGTANARVAKKIKVPNGWDADKGAHGTIHRKGRSAPTYRDLPGVGPKSSDEGTNIKAKGSFHSSTTAMVDRRYLRNYEPADLEVWRFSGKPFPDAHFATFPPELAERCILAGCPEGGRVLDPFAGAGTTGMVADRLCRDADLIELNPEYAAMAERRIRHDAGWFTDVSAPATPEAAE